MLVSGSISLGYPFVSFRGVVNSTRISLRQRGHEELAKKLREEVEEIDNERKGKGGTVPRVDRGKS